MPIQNRRFATRSHAVSPRRDTSPPASVPPRHSPHTPHLPRLTSTRDPRISQETCSRCAGARAPSRGRASRPRVRLSRRNAALFGWNPSSGEAPSSPSWPGARSSAPPSRGEGAPREMRVADVPPRAGRALAGRRPPVAGRARTCFLFLAASSKLLRDALGFFATAGGGFSIEAHPDPSPPHPPPPSSAVHSRVKMPSPQSVYTSLSIIPGGPTAWASLSARASP